jgi:hypothetical protein
LLTSRRVLTIEHSRRTPRGGICTAGASARSVTSSSSTS